MEWISIEKKTVPTDSNVLLYDGEVVFCGDCNIDRNGNACYGNQGCDGICYGWYKKKEITHWMPLPKPPKDL